MRQFIFGRVKCCQNTVEVGIMPAEKGEDPAFRCHFRTDFLQKRMCGIYCDQRRGEFNIISDIFDLGNLFPLFGRQVMSEGCFFRVRLFIILQDQRIAHGKRGLQ